MRARPALAVLWSTILLLAGQVALAATPALELDVELDPASRRFEAIAEIPAPSPDFRFELHESLAVQAASMDGKPLRFTAAGRDGAIRRWRVAVPGQAGKLRLEYGGILPALNRQLDHRGVLRGLPPMAAEAGSFLPAGGAWYPQPAPLFSYRVKVSVPAGQRVLAPGRLVGEEVPATDEGRYRAVFEFSRAADGIDLMAGPWVIREKLLPRPGGTAWRLRTYFYRELDAIPGLAEGYLDDTARYLERYSRQIGDYPFSEFSIVASPLPTGFGMPTLTYLGAEVLKLPFIRATSLGHEVLHNWWGNGVYVDYTQGNWCEGLTTFMADYAYKEQESASAARAMRLGWLRDFAAVPASEQQSLASFRSRTHGAAAAVGYGKSAMVFLMLRDLIGDAAFQRGLRAFWDRYRFKEAAWKDLQAAFEAASGRSLEGFFDQWLHRVGGPAVNIAAASAPSGAGHKQVDLTLSQSAPPYVLHLPVEMIYSDRAETRWIDVDHLQDQVRLPVDPRPEAVRLDPDLRVWRRLDPRQLPPILRQWIIAASPRLALVSDQPEVRDAAQALAGRLFESPPRLIPPAALAEGEGPLLLAGLHADVDAALAAAGLPPRPASLAGRGTAQVWTLQREAAAPLAVVSARDTDALRALLRPLPHYGAQSWLVFDGSQAIDRGVWPVATPLIPVRRQD